ncbi:hypothetical protein IFM89_010359 [Coptis chinensis]|uniref:Zinc finger HIT domain-containing protein 2 n=1 Tax=Coptis chinensis TaxID=261450 RepID=A0A835HV16_9MAGN|nr:hypothetical protein IFM89_010359 [Coptis chinensis]
MEETILQKILQHHSQHHQQLDLFAVCVKRNPQTILSLDVILGIVPLNAISLCCTESFMRENVVEQLGQMQPNDEAKQKMIDILKRVHSEDENESVDEDDVDDGNQFSLDDLSAEEMKKFQSTIASGELSKLIEPWEPWWLKPSARRISLSSEGTQLVQPVHQKDITMPAQHSMESGHSGDVPAGPETPIPPICKLTSTHPSPLLSVHLVDVVYSYCFTLRLYNGDWHSDALGAAMVLLSLSNVLGEGGQPESVSDVLSYCLEQTCSPAYRHAGGLQFGMGLLEDITCLLNLGGPAVVCLLCDLQRLIQAAEEQLNLEKPRKVKSDITSKFKLATRKVYFLMCWVHEKSGEAWSSLAAIIDLEKKSIDATNQGESRKAMQVSSKESKGKILIEEVQ